MKTLANLKMMFVGEVIAIASFFIAMCIYDGSLDPITSLGTDETIVVLLWCGVAFVITYIGNHIVKGVSDDVKDFLQWKKERSLKVEASKA